MAKNDNTMAIRMYESLKKHAGEDAAERLARDYALSKSADYVKKAKWAQEVCEYLENNFDDAKIADIRFDCACEPPARVIDAAKKLYEENADLEAFCEGFKEISKDDFSMWHEGGALFFAYPRCYCSCVKRAAQPISRTWCLCTLGYTKKMFEAILGKPCAVELLESIITGGARCVMKVEF